MQSLAGYVNACSAAMFWYQCTDDHETWVARSIPGEQVKVVPGARTRTAPSPAAPVSQHSVCAGYAMVASSACLRILPEDPRMSPPR